MGIVTDFLFGSSAAKAQKDAANAAAAASQHATDASLALQKSEYDTTRSDLAPWRTAGTNALAQLSDPTKNFMASPDYAFRLKQGTDSVTQNAAVAGLLHSGAALKGISDYGQNTASAEFGNWWNRQSGLAGVGQGAVNSTSQAGQNMANQSTNALLTNAQAQGQSSYAKGNAMAGLYGFLDGRANFYASQFGGMTGG